MLEEASEQNCACHELELLPRSASNGIHTDGARASARAKTGDIREPGETGN